MRSGFNSKVKACTIQYDSHLPDVDHTETEHFHLCKNFYWAVQTYRAQELWCRKKCCHFSIKMEEALCYQMGSPESSVILESAWNLTRCIKKNVNIKTSNYNKLIANPSCSPCFLTFNTLKPNTWKHWDALCSLKRKTVLITHSSIILSSENTLEK